MTGVILGAVLGYGMAIAAFAIFRWADRSFVSEPVAVPQEAPARGRLVERHA